MAKQDEVFLDQLVPQLGEAGIAIVRWADLAAAERKAMTEIYEERIFPVLTPLAVDPEPPVPLHLRPGAVDRRVRP